MKIAKLEMKLMMALFLMRYEFDLVDKDGKLPDSLPVRNRNDMYQVRVELLTLKLCIDAHPVPCSSICLGSFSWSYVLLQL